MKHPLLLLSTLLGIIALTLSATSSQAQEPRQEQELCVMSYNLRFASDQQPNAWPSRRPLMAEMLRNIKPDLIGTQEGLYPQLKDLASDLPEYEWIGLGREGGSRGEFMAIFYRKARFDPVAYDHFWLSDTPEIIGSTSWGNTVRRMVTWVRFLDRQTKREFYLVNTHFDHQVQASREKSAELLKKRIQALDSTLPVILTGDFNASASNKAYSILTDGGYLADTWQTARERVGEGLGTFNGFKEIPKNDTRIDWILTRGNVEVRRSEIVTFSRDGQFPSDHFPIVAWLRLN